MDQSPIAPPQPVASTVAKVLKRSSLVSLGCMSVALPLWLLFARHGGWGALSIAFIVAPALFLGCWALFILRLYRPDASSRTIVSVVDVVLLAGFYVAVFLRGLFLVDGNGSQASYNSFANSHLGVSLLRSQALSDIFNVLSIVLFAACLMYFIVVFLIHLDMTRRTSP